MLAPPLSSGDSDGTGSGLTQWCRLQLVGEMTVEAPGGADRGLLHSLVCGLCRHQPPGASLKSPCLRGSRVERVEGRGSVPGWLLQILGGSFALRLISHALRWESVGHVKGNSVDLTVVEWLWCDHVCVPRRGRPPERRGVGLVEHSLRVEGCSLHLCCPDN